MASFARASKPACVKVSALLLKDELHQYGMALSQWGEQVVRKLEALVNSYADAYRVQIHRISGGSGTAVNIARLSKIWPCLAKWELDQKL